MLSRFFRADPPAKNRITVESVRLHTTTAQFYCTSDLARKRAATVLTKEPGTIAWLDTIGTDDVLWDIGANVGVYTIYAALERHARVLAFEPTFQNFALLNRNIELNGLNERVTAYPIAITDADGVSTITLAKSIDGGANAQLGRHDAETPLHQGVYAASVDTLTQSLPFPSHIKIDVDGIEPLILAGAVKTLQNSRLRSVIIEADAADCTAAFESAGFQGRAAPTRRGYRMMVFDRVPAR